MNECSTDNQKPEWSTILNSPATGRNVSPVEPPSDHGCRHSNSLTGERHRRPSRRLNGLFWWAGHRGRCCEGDKCCFNHIISAHAQNKKAGVWLVFGNPVEAHKALSSWRGPPKKINKVYLIFHPQNSEVNIILCHRQTIHFQSLGKDGSQKALCLSQHMCEKKPVHRKLVTADKRSWRETIEESHRSMEKLWTQRAAGVRLTAAVLVRAVGAVGLLVTLVTGRDAGAIAQALKLLRRTPVARTLGGCGHSPQLSINIDNFFPQVATAPRIVIHVCSFSCKNYRKLQKSII